MILPNVLLAFSATLRTNMAVQFLKILRPGSLLILPAHAPKEF